MVGNQQGSGVHRSRYNPRRILQRGVAGSGFLRSLWQPSDGYRTGGLGGDVGSGVADHRKQLVQHRVHLRDRIDQQLALSPKG